MHVNVAGKLIVYGGLTLKRMCDIDWTCEEMLKMRRQRRGHRTAQIIPLYFLDDVRNEILDELRKRGQKARGQKATLRR